jgi:hypothetical protein
MPEAIAQLEAQRTALTGHCYRMLGYPANTVFGIGVLALVCLVLLLIPRTSIMGAILFTGYLGGAVASNVRAANPLFSHTLFPIYFAAILWTGLWLRDPRVAALFARNK